MFLEIILISVIFTIIAWKRLDLAFAVIASALPSYLIRFHIDSLPTTMLETLILILFLVWVIKIVFSKQYSVFKFPIKIPILLFLFAATISIFISKDKISALGIWKAYFIEPILLYLVFVNTIKNIKQIKLVVYGLWLSAFTISIYSILQYFSGIGLLYPWNGIDDIKRATGIFEHGNALGLYLGPIFVMLFTMLIMNLKNNGINHLPLVISRLQKVIFSLTIIISGLAIILSMSRGTWLSVLISLFIFALLYIYIFSKKAEKIRLKLIGIIVGSFIVIVILTGIFFAPVISPQRAKSSDNIRIEIWKTSLQILKNHPIFGVGLASFQETFSEFTKTWVNYPEFITPHALYPHNLYLALWLETGILGLIAFLWITITTFKKTSKSSYCLYTLPFALALFCILIHGLVDTPYFKNDLSCLFWIMLGVIIVFSLQNQKIEKFKEQK